MLSNLVSMINLFAGVWIVFFIVVMLIWVIVSLDAGETEPSSGSLDYLLENHLLEVCEHYACNICGTEGSCDCKNKEHEKRIGDEYRNILKDIKGMYGLSDTMRTFLKPKVERLESSGMGIRERHLIATDLMGFLKTY